MPNMPSMPTIPVRLPRQSRHPAHQQRLRCFDKCSAGATALRHLPKGDKLLPLRMGRTSLCRHQIRHRNRQTTDHRCPPSHSPNLEWLALASCSSTAPIGVSNYKGPTNGKVVAKTKTKLVMVATWASM